MSTFPLRDWNVKFASEPGRSEKISVRAYWFWTRKPRFFALVTPKPIHGGTLLNLLEGKVFKAHSPGLAVRAVFNWWDGGKWLVFEREVGAGPPGSPFGYAPGHRSLRPFLTAVFESRSAAAWEGKGNGRFGRCSVRPRAEEMRPGVPTAVAAIRTRVFITGCEYAAPPSAGRVCLGPSAADPSKNIRRRSDRSCTRRETATRLRRPCPGPLERTRHDSHNRRTRNRSPRGKCSVPWRVRSARRSTRPAHRSRSVLSVTPPHHVRNRRRFHRGFLIAVFFSGLAVISKFYRNPTAVSGSDGQTLGVLLSFAHRRTVFRSGHE